jgi:hypothetical protein
LLSLLDSGNLSMIELLLQALHASARTDRAIRVCSSNQLRLEGFRCADCTSRPFSGIDRRPYDGAVLQTYTGVLVVAEVKIAGVSAATAAARLEQWAGAPTWADGVAPEASSVLQRRACLSAPARKDRSRRH